MPTITDAAVIDRPVAEVWRFIADPSNDPRWYSDELTRMLLKGTAGPLEVRTSPEGPTRIGTEAAVYVAGRPTDLRARCTVLDAERELAWDFLSGITKGSRDRWRLRPVARGSTALTREFDLRVGGLARVLQPFVSRGTKRSHAAEIRNVKRILEGGAAEKAGGAV